VPVGVQLAEHLQRLGVASGTSAGQCLQVLQADGTVEPRLIETDELEHVVVPTERVETLGGLPRQHRRRVPDLASPARGLEDVLRERVVDRRLERAHHRPGFGITRRDRPHRLVGQRLPEDAVHEPEQVAATRAFRIAREVHRQRIRQEQRQRLAIELGDGCSSPKS